MATVNSLKLTDAERTALDRWRSEWGRIWRPQLRRFWAGRHSSYDPLYENDRDALTSLRPKLEPHLHSVRLPAAA